MLSGKALILMTPSLARREVSHSNPGLGCDGMMVTLPVTERFPLPLITVNSALSGIGRVDSVRMSIVRFFSMAVPFTVTASHDADFDDVV